MYEILIDASIKGSLILLGAAAAAGLLRTQPAAWRHLVWSAAVTAVLALPVISLFAPALAIPAAADAVQRISLTVYGGDPVTPAAAGEAGLPLILLWAVISGALLMRIAFGLSRVASVTWSGVVADHLAAELAAEMGIRRRVRVRLSDRVSMPTTWGMLRPAILLPASAREWEAGR